MGERIKRGVITATVLFLCSLEALTWMRHLVISLLEKYYSFLLGDGGVQGAF